MNVPDVLEVRIRFPPDSWVNVPFDVKFPAPAIVELFSRFIAFAMVRAPPLALRLPPFKVKMPVPRAPSLPMKRFVLLRTPFVPVRLVVLFAFRVTEPAPVKSKRFELEESVALIMMLLFTLVVGIVLSDATKASVIGLLDVPMVMVRGPVGAAIVQLPLSVKMRVVALSLRSVKSLASV